MDDRLTQSAKLNSQPVAASARFGGRSPDERSETASRNSATQLQPSVPALNTAGSSQTAAQTAAGGDFQAVPNVLMTAEQPSYHWQFYVGPDVQNSMETDSVGSGLTNSFKQSANSSKVIIAETGLTGFNIQEVEIDSTVAPNSQTLNQNAQKFKIRIAEPLGANLPDKLFLAAKHLDVKNFLKCPYYVSLNFLGYDTDSGAVKAPVDDVWTWKIMIIKLTTDLRETGSVHTIEAIGYNELANQNQFNLIATPINVDVSEDQGTVGDVIKKLTEEINANINKRYNKQPPYTVVIEDRPYQDGGKVSRPFEHKIIRDVKHKDSSRNQSKMQISRGTDVGKIVDYLIGNSETGVEMANPSTKSEDVKDAEKSYSYVHRVDTEVSITGYDKISQEYKREFKFIVRPYPSMRAIVSSPQEDQMPDKSSEKMSFALKKALMKKEYNYIFTGKNTEVLNLDLQLNFMFNVAANLYQGHISTEMASPGRQYDPEYFPKQTENTNWQPPAEGSGTGGIATRFAPGTKIAEKLSSDDISILPLSFTQDSHDPRVNVAPSLESSNLRSKSIYGMILNQLYGMMDGNLQTIELEIRGDPYWLGKDNTSSNDVAATDIKPNFLNGEHMYVLKFFIPQGINEETGDPILTTSEMYSGFYAVIRCVSKFTSGKFTQTLYSTRIPAMSVKKAFGQ